MSFESARVSQLEFDRVFLLFVNKYGFKSFKTGYAREQEYYKRDVFREARTKLNLQNWKKSDIGTGIIIGCVIDAIEIKLNNLFEWDSRHGDATRYHNSLFEARENPTLCKEYEQLFYELFNDLKTDEDSFNHLIKIAGQKYGYIAYLFFIKDSSKYLPIAPKNFDRAFKVLDIPFVTSKNCSWSNYQKFLDIMEKIKAMLIDKGINEALLLDAHSFCWIIRDMNDPKDNDPIEIPLPYELVIQSKIQMSSENNNDNDDDSSPVNSKERDAARREIGRRAQNIAFKSEIKRLYKAGKGKLAKQVKDVSENEKLGYDISSFNEDGTPRYIEVKAIRNWRNLISFILTDNELQVSRSKNSYYFYLVSDVNSKKPRVEYLHSEKIGDEYLKPKQYYVNLPPRIR